MKKMFKRVEEDKGLATQIEKLKLQEGKDSDKA
jgi:hypothetical protein